MMMPEDQYKYNESVVLPFREEGDNKVSSYTSAINIAKKDFLLGVNKVDRALAGQIAGLEVVVCRVKEVTIICVESVH